MHFMFFSIYINTPSILTFYRTFDTLSNRFSPILSNLRNGIYLGGVEYALSVQAVAGLVSPHAVYKEVHMYVGYDEGI